MLYGTIDPTTEQEVARFDPPHRRRRGQHDRRCGTNLPVVAQGKAEAQESAWACRYHAENLEAFLEPEPRDSDGSEAYLRVDPLARQAGLTVAAGACVLCGGGPVEGKGLFYPPTVLTDVPAGSPGVIGFRQRNGQVRPAPQFDYRLDRLITTR
jgi:hypothetical protein